MNAPVPAHVSSGAAPERAKASVQRAELHRQLTLLRIRQRLLGQCTGAQFATWLARATAFGFIIAAAYMAGPLPGALDAVQRLALTSLSWCAGLAALSAAGPGPESSLRAGLGLIRARSISAEEVGVARPMTLATWIMRHFIVLALLVLVPYLALASTPAEARDALACALGTIIYVTALGVGLGLLASACHALGQKHGQTALLALVIVPELASPIFPGLPTLSKVYSRLLDICLGLELSL